MGWFAVLLIICGFLGDFFNNTKALTGSWFNVSLDDAGLVMLAFAIAGSVTALGYAATKIHKGYWVGALLMMACSASLTLYAQWGDVESRDRAAETQSALLPSLIAEKDRLLDSLPRCEQSSWCRSQDKEARIAEINREMARMEPETGNPGGEWLAYALLFAVSIGAPIGNLFCSAMASKLLTRKPKQDQNEVKHDKTNVVSFKKKLSVMRERFTGAAVERSRKILGSLSKLTPKRANRSVQHETVNGFERGVNGDDHYDKAVKAVNILFNKGEKPSVRNVMDVRQGSKRVAPGRREDIGAHLRKMHDEGLLIKKGQGYWYADHYATKEDDKKSIAGK